MKDSTEQVMQMLSLETQLCGIYWRSGKWQEVINQNETESRFLAFNHYHHSNGVWRMIWKTEVHHCAFWFLKRTVWSTLRSAKI